MRAVINLVAHEDGAIATLTDRQGTALIPGSLSLLVERRPNGSAWMVRPASVAGAIYEAWFANDLAPLEGVLERVADRSISGEDLVCLGRVLFDATLGSERWRAFLEVLAQDPDLVELAIQLGPSLEGLHDLNWELLHDGAGFLALGGAPKVSVVRVVCGPDSAPLVKTIDGVPRVLFAVGTKLTEDQIRPGAEFLGILRRLERDGGVIQPKLVDQATVDLIERSVATFLPDLVHVIAHGHVNANSLLPELQVRPLPGADTADVWISAQQLAGLLGTPIVPTAVVLSACDTARSGVDGVASIARELVELGVAFVVAMAGEVSDTACRLYTRALAGALVNGGTLGVSSRTARLAAAGGVPGGSASVDWALPVLYIADRVPVDHVAIDPTRSREVNARITKFQMGWKPVFCGRAEFMSAFDLLVDPADKVGVLGAILTGPGVGSKRLLAELGARALRAGHVPVMIGPYTAADEKRPRDLASFVLAVSEKILYIRTQLGLPMPPSRAEQASGAAPNAAAVRSALRDDLFALARDAVAIAPPGTEPDAMTPVLMLAGIHEWDHALPFVLESCDPSGFGPGPRKLPLVYSGSLAGEVSSLVKDELENYDPNEQPWKRLETLDHWQPSEDELAYRWLLLNPARLGDSVYAEPRNAERGAWIEECRLQMAHLTMQQRVETLFVWAKVMEKNHGYFVANNDDAALAAYPEIGQ